MNLRFLMSRNLLLLTVLWVGLSLLGGCCLFRRTPPVVHNKSDCYLLDGMPSYRTLAYRYNKNALKIEKIRARADIEMTWYDDRGRHFENGSDSLVVLWRPNRFAVSIGKLGKDFFWAGFDDERYWLFQNFKDKHAFVGRHENYNKIGTKRMPIPVGPEHWPAMMGLLPLPEPLFQNDYGPKVTLDKDCLLKVKFPDKPIRLSIEPNTFKVKAVEFLDDAGQPWMRSDLYGHVPIDQTFFDEETGEEMSPPGRPPIIASRIRVTWTDRKDLLEVILFDPSNRRVKPNQFDFEALKEVFEPRTLVDLDDETLTPEKMKQFRIESSGTDSEVENETPSKQEEEQIDAK